MTKRLLVGLLLAGLVTGLAHGAVTIMVLWSGDELAAFQKVADGFTAKTGIAVRVESVGRDLPAILSTR
ncbi:MAG: carbohydrate ABC transporter substrate-binding protein, partial [Candidatus Bipolaricaulota bacterium]